MVNKKVGWEKKCEKLEKALKISEENTKLFNNLEQAQRYRADDSEELLQYLIDFVVDNAEMGDFITELIEKVRKENEGEETK